MGCIRVRFGGPVALATGTAELCVELSEGATLGLTALVDLLRRRYPALADELSRDATEWGWPTAVAVNGAAIDWDHLGDVQLRDGDEVYFFKLVAGG